MPNFFLNTNEFATGVRAPMGVDSSAWTVVAEGVTSGSSTVYAISGFGFSQHVTVAGTAISHSWNTIFLNGGGARVTVLGTGQVSHLDPNSGAAINLYGAGSIVRNDGRITGATGVEVNTNTGGGQQIVNHGLISGSGFGWPGSLFVIPVFGAGVLINTDDIESAVAGTRVSVVNTGTISGARLDSNAPGYAILQIARAPIDEDTDYASLSDQANSAVTIVNSGTLMGHVKLLNQNDVLQNSGLVQGDVEMGGGDDLVDSRHGQVAGTVFGGVGNDTVIGGEGVDSIFGGTGDDAVWGLGGDDVIHGDNGNDTLRGGAGDDMLYGGANADLLHGGSGDDMLFGDSGTDLLYGDGGNDSLYGGTADDTLYGGAGDDWLDGGANADLIFGGAGNDMLLGDSGTDTLFGGAGEDTLYGGTADDSLDGGSGDDVLYGGANNDTLRGSLGDDFLSGDAGDDLIYGGSGNDTILSGLGRDTLFGGAGVDVFVWAAAAESPHGSDRDTIGDFQAGVDRIDLSAIMPGLTFVAAFTNVAGQVRYADNLLGGTLGRLYVDTTGNGASNLSIDLLGGPGLTADDLIL